MYRNSSENWPIFEGTSWICSIFEWQKLNWSQEGNTQLHKNIQRMRNAGNFHIKFNDLKDSKFQWLKIRLNLMSLIAIHRFHFRFLKYLIFKSQSWTTNDFLKLKHHPLKSNTFLLSLIFNIQMMIYYFWDFTGAPH